MNRLKELILGPQLPDRLLWLRRRETWAGDVKANWIRLAILSVFTVNEFINYSLLHVVDEKFHVGSLVIVLLWIIATFDFHILLKRHWLARSTPYLMPSVDVFLTTWLLFLADGPKSPLIVVYFLVIAMAAVRLDPLVVLYTSFISAFGYVCVWDFAKHQKPEYLVPVYHVAILVLALLAAGLIASHLLSRVYNFLLEIQKDKSNHA